MPTLAKAQEPGRTLDAPRKFDPNLTERRSKEHAVLSSLLKKASDPEVGFDELENHLRYLFASAKHYHDWSVISDLSRGNVHFVDALYVPAKYEEANFTPIDQYEGFSENAEVPNWLSGYANVFLSTKGICKSYSQDRLEEIADGTWFDALRKRLMEAWKGKRNLSLSMVMSVKFLSDAIRIFERDVQAVMPDVTSTPSFFLLLASYETLHAAGYRPCHVRWWADSKATYLDLIQMFLERFPEKTHPKVHEYLSGFSFRWDEADYRSSLLSRIDYEGDMERIFARGEIREKAIDGLMGRIRTKMADIERGGA